MNVNLVRAQHGHEFDLDETRDPYLLIPADPEKVRALAGALRTVAADGLLPINARLVEGRTRVVPWHGDAGDAVRTRLSLYDSITADMARLADQSAGLLEAYAEHITLARAQAWQSVNEYATGRALSGVGRYAEGVSWCRLGVTRLAMARAALRAAAALLSTALDQVSQVLPTSPSLGEHPAWHVMLLGQNLLDGLAGMADLALWFCDTDRALVTMINPLGSEQHRAAAAEHVRGVTAKLLALADHPDKIARALADSTTLELSPLAWALGMGDPFAKDRSIMQIIRSEYAPPTRYQLLDQQRLVVGRPYGFSAGAGPTVPDTLDAGDVADFQLPTGLHEDLAVRGDGGLVHNGWDDTEDVVPDYSDDVGVEDHHAVDYRLHHADMDEYRHRWPANDSLDDYRHERDLENTRLAQQHLTRPEVLPLNTPATTTGWQLPDDGPPLTATQKLAHERAVMAQGDITDLVEGHGRIPAHVKNLLWADPAYRQSAQDTLDTLLTRLHGQDPATLGPYGEQLLAQQTERAHRLRGFTNRIDVPDLQAADHLFPKAVTLPPPATVVDELDAADVAGLHLPTGLHEDLGDLEHTRLAQQTLAHDSAETLHHTPAATTGWQLPAEGTPLAATGHLAHERALMAQGDITDLVEGHGRIPAHVKNLLQSDPAYRQSAQDTLDTLLTRLHGQDPATLGPYGEQLLAQQTERAEQLHRSMTAVHTGELRPLMGDSSFPQYEDAIHLSDARSWESVQDELRTLREQRTAILQEMRDVPGMDHDRDLQHALENVMNRRRRLEMLRSEYKERLQHYESSEDWD